MLNPLMLTIALTQAELKLKNEGSHLGFIWYLLNPLLMFGLLLLVFSHNLGKNIEHYPLYLLLGIILFNTFRIITTEATQIIYNNRLIIKSINFQKQALVASLVTKSAVTHLIEIFLFSALLLFFGLSLKALVFYPILFLFFLIFSFGVSLLLSALTIRFMDLDNIWQFAMQLLWFATPIFYSIENNSFLEIFNTYNPLYYFISCARDILIANQLPSPTLMLGVVFSSLFALTLGEYVFMKSQKKFAEYI